MPAPQLNQRHIDALGVKACALALVLGVVTLVGDTAAHAGVQTSAQADDAGTSSASFRAQFASAFTPGKADSRMTDPGSIGGGD